MPNPFDPNADRYRAQQENAKRRQERPYAREMLRIFRKASREAAEATAQGLDWRLGPYITRGMGEDVARVMRGRNESVARWWGNETRKHARKQFGALVERKGYEEDFELWLQRWLATYTAGKIVQVTDTTRDQIRRAVDHGLREGLGAAQLARYIRRTSDIISQSRALTIARTETSGAANAATINAADALDIEVVREWVAVEDGRTRPTHAAADGQQVGRGESFQVGGASLSQPGDPSGPAAEIINCRCGVALRNV